MSARALFLDRDGTLMVDVGYPCRPDQVRLLPGVAEGLSACRDAGYLLSIISNQSGVGRGYFGVDALQAVHERLLTLLAQSGVRIDDTQYCLHAPEEGCECRKPSPLMIRRSASRLGVDPAQSFMIGDKMSDMEAGREAGCRTILLGPPDGRSAIPGVDYRCADWQEVVRVVRGGPVS